MGTDRPVSSAGSASAFEESYFGVRYGHGAKTWDKYCLSRLAKPHADFLSKAPSGNRSFADIGCGLGDMLEIFSPHFELAVGGDISKYSTAVCKQKGMMAVRVDARHLCFAKESLDAIYVGDVLDRLSIEDGIAVLRDSFDALRRGGRIVALVLNWHSRIINDHLFDDYTHTTIFTRERLRSVAEISGFRGFTREEYTLAGVPGVVVIANRLKQLGLAFFMSHSYSLLTRRKLHLVYYGEKP